MPLNAYQHHVLSIHKQHSTAIRNQADSYVVNLWARYAATNNFGDSNMGQMVELVSGMSGTAQRQMSLVSEAYITSMGQAVGVATAPGPAVDVSVEALRGVSAEEVYGRIPETVYTALNQGDDIHKAQKKGLDRLRKVIATNIQLAKTHTFKEKMQRQNGVVGYRRVLVGPENCALCIIASTQRYTVGSLQPIHPGCDCTVAPITGTSDPGWVIDRDALENVHIEMKRHFDDYKGGARSFIKVEGEVLKYRDVIVTREHGEIGPVLEWKHHKHFTPLDG